MNNSLSLRTNSKGSDDVLCETCGKGTIVPDNPESEINHSFHCDNCGIKIHLEANVVVE